MQKELRIEVGRAWLPAEEVAKLDVGGRVALNGLPGGPWVILAEGVRIASGTPAVADDAFCVHVREVSAAPTGPR